jgi:hypothetical protein
VELVQQGLVTNVQAARGFFTAPVHFIERAKNQFLLNALDAIAASSFREKLACGFVTGRDSAS